MARLVGTPFTDERRHAPLRHEDILVVAPYNAQVTDSCGRSSRPRCAVGTVDKFQGQEAPVVVVSMASSTPEDAPRGIGFAFDRHRFNVATSRAQCRAVLVVRAGAARRRLPAVEQMRLVAAVCRFVELAEETRIRQARDEVGSADVGLRPDLRRQVQLQVDARAGGRRGDGRGVHRPVHDQHPAAARRVGAHRLPGAVVLDRDVKDARRGARA